MRSQPTPNDPVSCDEHESLPANEFDTLFLSEDRFGGFGRLVHTLDPALPDEIEPFSFLSSDLLHHIADELALHPDQLLADLGCGRGGPGLWLAHIAGAELIGIDRSAVATAQARDRAAASGMRHKSGFIVSDLTATGLVDASVSAAISIDALQYAVDRRAAVTETRRILRPGGRLVLTGWHPRHSGDPRLPPRHRSTDWPAALCTGGFTGIRCHTRPAWDEAYRRIYRRALQMGAPGPDAALAGLQSEARRRLPTAHLLRRVAVTAIAL